MPRPARLRAARAAAPARPSPLVALAALAAAGAGARGAAPGDPLALERPRRRRPAHGRRRPGPPGARRSRATAASSCGSPLAAADRRVPADRRRGRPGGGNRDRERPGAVRLPDRRAGTTAPGPTTGRSSAPAPTDRAPRPRSRRLVLTSGVPSPPDLAGLSSERIPGRVGSSNGASFVIRTGGIPAGVDRARYLALVRNAGRRWRLHSLGTMPGRSAVRQRPLRGRLLDRPGAAPGAGGHRRRASAGRRDDANAT